MIYDIIAENITKISFNTKQLFVCLLALFAVANAGLLGHLVGGGGGVGVGGVHRYGPDHNHGHSHGHGHGGSAKVFKVKVIEEGPDPGFGHIHHQAQAPQLVRFIHQQSSVPRGLPSRPGPPVVPRVIRLIHQQAEVHGAASSPGAILGPVSAPAQVIRVIHEHSAGNGGHLASSGSSILPQISDPAKIIRIIHELGPSHSSAEPAASFPSANAVAPYNYLPPVQTPAQNYNPPVLSAQPSQNIAPSTQYLPPLPSAPLPTFSAPEPVPSASHIPAQSYGVP